MSEENFVDYVKINCRSGKGGAGSAHFRREKFEPKGGPDGGDGGRGGDILVKGNEQLWTLLHLKYRKHVIAPDGEPGGSSQKSGKSGKDQVLEVPLGTVARDAESGEILFEITQHDEERVLVKGGLGGLGNVHFKSPTNRTPRYAQPGETGQDKWMILELKLLADVGLVGFPNAGKSTFLSVISAAKPKIANYPFTTLKPNLGMVPYKGGKSFVVADIPGIIEEAHKGKGLGHRFLRHIERNAVLLFMVPCDTDDIDKEFRILLNEVEAYNPELIHKPRLLAITKSDMLDEVMQKQMKALLPTDVDTTFISSVANYNIEELKDKLWSTLNASYDEEE